MDIDDVRCFLELASSLNYTKASERLHMTQSALSKRIVSLESEFGSRFFDRSHKQIVLTHQGRIFCEGAQAFFDQYEELKRRLKNTHPSVRIGGRFEDPSISFFFNESVFDAIEAEEGIQVDIIQNVTCSLVEELLSGNLDLFIDIALDNDNLAASLESCILLEVPLVAVVNKKHPFSTRKEISLSEIGQQTILCPAGSYPISKGAEIINRACARHGSYPKKRFFYAQSVLDFQSVDVANDIFIMPSMVLSKQVYPFLGDEYTYIPFSEPDAVFSFRIVWRRDEKKEHVLRLIDILVEKMENNPNGNLDFNFET